jgi:MFS family permease
MFGVFLFLTYYLQQTLGYSPVKTGLAFLPMTGALILAAGGGSSRLMPRIGPKPLLTLGLLLAAAGMVLLTGVTVDSTYAGHVLPGLLVVGAGLGFTMSTAVSTATRGVRPADAGVASAMVNTAQQIGGSIGTALLSTLATTAATNYMVGKPHTPGVLAQAAVHGYTTGFWISAAIFATGAIACGLLLRWGVPEIDPLAAPVMAH